jgi:hypothetical protein
MPKKKHGLELRMSKISYFTSHENSHCGDEKLRTFGTCAGRIYLYFHMYKKWVKCFGFHASFGFSPRFPALGASKKEKKIIGRLVPG